MGTAVHQEDVQPAVVVEIQKGPSPTQGFDEVFLRSCAIFMAIEAARESVRLEDDPINLAFLLYTLGRAGEQQEAREGLVDLLEITKQQYVCPYEVATVYVGLEEYEEAIDWFEKGYEARADCWVWGAVDPRMEEMRKDERYLDLLRRVGHSLPEL